MNKRVIFGLLVVMFLFAGQASASPPAKYSEQLIVGRSYGNHRLDCTVIRPWRSTSGPGRTKYPVIVWGNSWGGGNIVGEDTTAGYKPGLIEWALDGPYIVIAANQWSVQERDILTCLRWIVDQNRTAGSEYEGVVNEEKIGLAGHSQGGGVVIKMGDYEPIDYYITAVVAMNPWGPRWEGAEIQDGPVMLLGGEFDEITPVESFEAAWLAIQTNDQGGLLAVLDGGNHNDDAWGPDGEDPTLYNFGNYQSVTELWWQFLLNDNAKAGRDLKLVLDQDPPWDTDYSFTDSFDL